MKKLYTLPCLVEPRLSIKVYNADVKNNKFNMPKLEYNYIIEDIEFSNCNIITLSNDVGCIKSIELRNSILIHQGDTRDIDSYMGELFVNKDIEVHSVFTKVKFDSKHQIEKFINILEVVKNNFK